MGLLKAASACSRAASTAGSGMPAADRPPAMRVPSSRSSSSALHLHSRVEVTAGHFRHPAPPLEPKIVVVECQGALVADGQPPHFPQPHLLRVALGGSGTLVCFCLDAANLPQREPLNGVGFSIVTTVQPAAAGVLGAVLPTTRTTYPAVSRKGRCREAWEMAASRLGLGRDRCLTGFWRREMEARSPERCSNANVRQQTNG